MSDRSHLYPALLDVWPLPQDIDGRHCLFNRLAVEEIERVRHLYPSEDQVCLGVVKFWEVVGAAVDLENMTAHQLIALRRELRG